MKERLLLATNLSLFTLAALVLGSLQTALWFQIFGYFPGPALWIPCLIHVALHRSTLEAAVFAYLCAFVLSTMTAMPEGILMIVNLALVLSTQLFKRRFYWESSSYLMLTCGLAAFLFNIYHWAATFILSDHPLTSPAIMDWLIEALLTPLAAPPLFPLFVWIDKITGREPTTDVTAHIS